MKSGGILAIGILGLLALKSGLFSGIAGGIGDFISGGGGSGESGTPTNSGDIGLNDAAAVASYIDQHGAWSPSSGFIKSNSTTQLSPSALATYPALSTAGVLRSPTILYANQGALSPQSAINIANYNAVKQNPSLAWDYAGGNFEPNVSQEGIAQSSWAYQTSQATIDRRALAYMSQQTGAHRGSMSASERSAWDAANIVQARSAYLAASGQATRAQSPYVVH